MSQHKGINGYSKREQLDVYNAIVMALELERNDCQDLPGPRQSSPCRESNTGGIRVRKLMNT